MLIDGNVTTGPQSGQIGYKQSGTNCEIRHCPVPDTIAGRWNWGIQRRLDFFADQIGRDKSVPATSN
jgi:hypothetical protein